MKDANIDSLRKKNSHFLDSQQDKKVWEIRPAFVLIGLHLKNCKRFVKQTLDLFQMLKNKYLQMKHNTLNTFNGIHPTILALRYFYNTFTISFLQKKARNFPFSTKKEWLVWLRCLSFHKKSKLSCTMGLCIIFFIFSYFLHITVIFRNME